MTYWKNILTIQLLVGAALSLALSACNPMGSHSTIQNGFLGGVSLSLSNSTLTVSEPQIVAGGQTQLTLTTRDQNGNIFISPNPLSISFSESGGTSQGSFSAVTNNGNGTYTAYFTGTTSGTTIQISSSIQSSYANGPVTGGSAFVRVMPGNYSLTHSYVTASSLTLASGSSLTLTLHTLDQDGNPLTSGGLSVAFFSLSGTSTGTFSAVTDNNDGTYSCTFTGILAGSPVALDATILGQEVTGNYPTITLTPGAPAQIAVVTGSSQSGIVESALSQALTVAVKDAHGNVIPSVTVSWSVTGSGSPVLGSAVSPTNASGQAMNTLTLGSVAGIETVTASIPGTSLSANFTETALSAALASFTLSGVPANATAGTPFNVTLTARDAFGNVDTAFTGSVHWSSTDPDSVLPSDYTFQSSDLGAKSFPFTLKTSGNQTLTASLVGSGSPTVTSSAITVGAGNATQLIFVTGPVNETAGTAFPSLAVRALDAAGNTASSFNGSITIAIGNNAGSATLSGTASVTATGGTASFPGLSLNKIGPGYTLTASSSGLSSATSSSFNITAAAPASIAISSGNNQTGTVGQALSSPFIAVVKDSFGNVVTGSTVNWTTSAGNLSSTSNSTGVNGLSQSTLTLGNTAGAETITATVNGTALSTSFTATANASSTIASIAFGTAPATSYTASSSSPMTAFTVKLLDSYGNVITSNSSTTLTVSLASGTGTLGGTLTTTAASGIATLSNATYTKAESITLLVTENTLNHTVSSSAITVSPNVPAVSSSTIAAAASPESADGATTDAITITLKDAYGNPVPGQTVAFSATGSGNTLTQPASVTNASGQA
ncbi:MAG: invasin domain 3-containing protein, partial [Oligoflexia bacterium]|nr:invasin domain 3-containing protein [Oligoflexia bacterium]